MRIQDIIRAKRDGDALDADSIGYLVASLVDGSMDPSQAGAMAMAVYLQSMNAAETGALTRAMASSGRIIDWSAAGLDGPVVDKHSTGGVGDKVSLMLAPMVAATGAFVPMISGRSLGHGGGTLDKLDSIPGYDTGPDLGRFQSVVARVGCAIIGQTAELAPADRRLYAVRDATATVESIPLITASILSKKMAAGLQALVMDIKTGNGAFMQTPDQARALANSIVAAAAESGLPTRAIISDMSQVLGHSAGNAVEIAEVIDYLTGVEREPRLHEVVLALGTRMLCMTGLAADEHHARARLQTTLDDGAAAARFADMVTALGGPADLLEHPGRYLPVAPVICPVFASTAGFITAVDTRAVGNAIVRLGGGRTRVDAVIDHAVGLTQVAGPGDYADRERCLARVHARTEDDAEVAAAALRQAYRIGEQAPASAPVVLVDE